MSDFKSLGLSEPVLQRLEQIGFITPTPVQAKVLPELLNGSNKDMVALAQTGTGKTAAFGLPLIELCDPKNQTTQALILAPTRELCVQIAGDLESFTQGVKSFNITPVYGGASITDQIRKIKRGTQIIVATPGRLIDLLEKKAVKIDEIQYFVLDEADEMLKMGFKEAIDTILSHTADHKSVWLFSATMPPEIAHIAASYMNSPVEVAIGSKNQSNENIAHKYVVINNKDRYAALKRILDYHFDIYGVIFCRTKMETQETADMLLADGYNADSLHGDLSQPQRDKVLNNFRNRSLQMLVATDVAARGIDIDDITHVLHYNLPDEMEYYTHRSGRTARAGKKGISVALVTAKEVQKIQQLERKIKVKFEQMLVPTGREICKQKMLALIKELEEVKINEEEIAPFMPMLHESLDSFSKEEVIAKFASLEFNHFLDYYRNSIDINPLAGGNKKERRDERYGADFRFFINLGKMDDIEKRDLLDLLYEETGVFKRDIHRIELKGAYSFFEVETAVQAEKIKKGLMGKWLNGRQIRVELAGAKDDVGDKKKKRRDDGGFKGGSKKKSFEPSNFSKKSMYEPLDKKQSFFDRKDKDKKDKNKFKEKDKNKFRR